MTKRQRNQWVVTKGIESERLRRRAASAVGWMHARIHARGEGSSMPCTSPAQVRRERGQVQLDELLGHLPVDGGRVRVRVRVRVAVRVGVRVRVRVRVGVRVGATGCSATCRSTVWPIIDCT